MVGDSLVRCVVLQWRNGLHKTVHPGLLSQLWSTGWIGWMQSKATRPSLSSKTSRKARWDASFVTCFAVKWDRLDLSSMLHLVAVISFPLRLSLPWSLRTLDCFWNRLSDHSKLGIPEPPSPCPPSTGHANQSHLKANHCGFLGVS